MSESAPTGNEREILRMEPWDFDQGPNGWRKIQDAGDFVKAAEVILKYIHANKDRILSQDKRERNVKMSLLYFHRGQMLAAAGQEHWTEAVESLKQSFEGDECWDAYVSATIGFPEGNKEKVERAIQTIESAKQEEKGVGNIGIVRNFKKALEEGVRDYAAPYSWPRDERL